MKNGDTNTRRDGEEAQVPKKLIAALKEPSSRCVFVPPTIDESILNAARRHLAGPQRTGFRFLRSWILWPATVTACLVLAGLTYFSMRHNSPTNDVAREDINHDGQVDILDAFQLARQLPADAKSAPGLDLNGDGVVDQRDAEVIAIHAVKLEKGGRS